MMILHMGKFTVCLFFCCLIYGISSCNPANINVFPRLLTYDIWLLKFQFPHRRQLHSGSFSLFNLWLAQLNWFALRLGQKTSCSRQKAKLCPNRKKTADN